MIEESIKVYKNLIKARSEDCINYRKEIERLNNIIDELENFIKTYSIPEFTLKESHREFMETKIILDKIKSLKEGKE